MAFLAAQAADLHSTAGALTRGAREGNALLGPEFTRQLAIKSAASAGIILIAHKVEKHHPKLAKGLLYGSSLFVGAIAARNYRVQR